MLNKIQIRTNFSELYTYQFMLAYFFNEIILHFHIFQSKFLTYVFFKYIQNLLVKEIFSYRKYIGIILSFFSYLLGENKLVLELSFRIKSIKSMQKYQHITELFAFIQYIFALIFLLSLNFLISFGICSTLKLSQQVILLPLIYKAIQ